MKLTRDLVNKKYAEQKVVMVLKTNNLNLIKKKALRIISTYDNLLMMKPLLLMLLQRKSSKIEPVIAFDVQYTVGGDDPYI